eukprot:2148686-Rhodomonas_salina.3
MGQSCFGPFCVFVSQGCQHKAKRSQVTMLCNVEHKRDHNDRFALEQLVKQILSGRSKKSRGLVYKQSCEDRYN